MYSWPETSEGVARCSEAEVRLGRKCAAGGKEKWDKKKKKKTGRERAARGKENGTRKQNKL